MNWALPVAIVVLMTAVVLDYSAPLAADDGYEIQLVEINSGKLLDTVNESAEKPIVVHIWSANCPHCKLHMPYVVGLLEKLDASQADFVTCCVNSTRQEALDYVNERSLDFPVHLENSGALGSKYYELGWPTTFVLTADGRYVGYSDSMGSDYYSEILKLVEQASYMK